MNDIEHDNDDELINELVPPKRPRWQVACAVLALVAFIAGIFFAASEGVVVPRLEASLVSTRVNADRSVDVIARVHNAGRRAQIEHIGLANTPGLSGGSVRSRLPLSVPTDGDADVALHFSNFDCMQVAFDPQHGGFLRMDARGPVPLTVTRNYVFDPGTTHEATSAIRPDPASQPQAYVNGSYTVEGTYHEPWIPAVLDRACNPGQS